MVSISPTSRVLSRDIRHKSSVSNTSSFRRRKITERSAVFSCSYPERCNACCSSVWFSGGWTASRRRATRHNRREFEHWRFISSGCGGSQKRSAQRCSRWVVVRMMGVIRWIKVGHATWLRAGRRVYGETKGRERRRWMRQCYRTKTRIPFLVMCFVTHCTQVWSVRR